MIVSKCLVFRFSDVEVREREFRASRAGQALEIEPKAFRVLLCLLRHAGHLVTKSELMQEVWSEVAVTDNSLTRAIAVLRRVLDDDPHQPRYIETVAKLGYRFICPVDEEEDLPVNAVAVTAAASTGDAGVESSATVAGADVPSPPILSRWTRRKLGLTIGATALVLVCAAGAAWYFHRPAPSPHIESIAVLPFANLSGDPAQEYFADGMTAELITDLGAFGSVRVISRTSVMRFKGSSKPLREIAHELGVDGIVEGTVAHSGNRIRVTANLLDPTSDRHLWAKSYEGEMEDILVVQNKVARSVADAVGVELTRRGHAPATVRRVNPEAYRAYLEGKYSTLMFTRDGFKKAEASLRRSIELDPTFAPAYSEMANFYFVLGINGIRSATELIPLAKAAALKAVELDDNLADAHGNLGLVKLVFDWDWAGAEQEMKRAVLLNPSSIEAHGYYAQCLIAMGRQDEGLREAREMLRLDPASPFANMYLGWDLYWARRHDEAILQLNRVLELDPGYPWAYMELGWNYAEKRMYPQAIGNCRKALDVVSDIQVLLSTCGRIYGLAGRRQEALALLTRLQKIAEKEYVDPWYIAWLYDGLGDVDRAINYLQRAYIEHSCSLYLLKVVVVSDRLRSDPRFQDLLKKLNFPS